MKRPRVLSGVQPTGKMHVGNYLGALKNFVELQNSGKYECFFMIADYHSITEDYDPETKPQQIIDLALDFLALGLDPKKSIIFLQSQVPQHLELAWIFSTLTPVSELVRMTQYKDKAARQEKNINAGLFTYPVLQAVDILIYRPQFVPVGQDQLQHLELANDIAKKFNRRFGETFQAIKPLLTPAARVMGLLDPAKKMSKSEPEGCLFLTDEPEELAKKLKKAVTDTAPTGPEKTPGVANLFDLLDHFGTKDHIERFHQLYKNRTIKYAELKGLLADRVADHFAEFRQRRKALAGKPETIKQILAAGSNAAKKIAIRTLAEVKQKIGLAL
ncbi:MAG: tryptophan--tRNA ligase [Candidatus Doudnabacteria bacterium]|nr:tryptophan--tRNA ligase [Candidatus Doudnabacteria bacterium]